MDMQKFSAALRPLAAGLAIVALAGCATFSQDGGLGSVAALTSERTGQTVQFPPPTHDANMVEGHIRQLLQQPLSPETAVQIALLNNPGLRASLAELGIAEADLVQAGRLRNPGLSFSRMHGGGELEIERGILFDLAGLLLMPLRTDIESRRFERAKLQAAADAVRLAAAARAAYFNAVAARQTVGYMEHVQTAAEAGAELARRMARVGNWSQLDAAREHVFHADAAAQLARVRHAATAAREQLTRLLGLWGADIAFELPERLPELPQAPREMIDIEAQAISQRLDVQMARRDAEATASALGLTRTTRFINVFDAGYVNKSVTDKPRENGYALALELPLFDWGDARSVRAEATYMQAVHRVAESAIRARSEVREAYSGYRTAYDLARHLRDEIVPLRKKISDQVLLRYNGMLASVFELLADARDQAHSVNAAIEAQRDFWIADTGLRAAVNGSGPVSGTTVAARH